MAPAVVSLGGELADTQSEPAAGGRPFQARLLLRHKGIILSVFLLAGGAALGAIWTLIVPMYRATSLIEVRSEIPVVTVPTEETGPVHQYQQRLRTQVAIMTSSKVLQRVLERTDVKGTAWYREPGPLLDRAIGRASTRLDHLMTGLSVQPVSGTELIEVSMVARDPLDAKIVTDGVQLEYMDFVRERFSREDRQKYEHVQRQKEQTEVLIRLLENKIDDILDELRIPSPEERLSQRAVRLDQLEGELAQVTLDIAVSQDQLGELTNATTSQPAGAPDDGSSMDYEEDAEWRKLRAMLAAAEMTAEIDRQRFGPRSDRMRRHETTIQLARQAVDARQKQLNELAQQGLWPAVAAVQDGDTATSPSSLRSRVRLMTIRKEHLEEYVEELRKSFDREFDQATALSDNREQLDLQKKWLTTLETRLRQLDENKRSALAIRPIAEATVPARPERDKRFKLSIAAIIGALGLALACAYIRVAFSSQVQEVDEVRRTVEGAFLGYFPFRRGYDGSALDHCPLQAESVRMVRTAVLNRLDDTGGSIVQLTSAAVSSGKSTLAAMLASSLAQLSKRVLLVEADLHRPSLAKRFAIDPSPGLLNILVDRGAEADGIRHTAHPSLDVVPVGTWKHQGDMELLANGELCAWLNHWRSRYDVILLDGPPLLLTADASILSRHSDGTIMVVRERHCRREALIDALAMLTAAGGKLLGTVFVGPLHAGGYGYGYGYAQESTGAARSPDMEEDSEGEG